MVKSVSSALTTHLAGDVLTVCVCWTITRTDGVIYRYTEHDTDVIYGGNRFKAAFGFRRTNFANKSDLSVNNLDVVGVLDDEEIDENDLRGGLFDDATVETFLVNYEDPDGGQDLKLMKGFIGEVTIRDGQFTFEMRSLEQKLAQIIGENYTPTCRADLGDARCKVATADFTQGATVQSVTDRTNFNATRTAGGELQNQPTGTSNAPTGWFNGGLVTWTSGLNNGLKREVKRYTSGGDIELYLPMPFDVEAGDTFDIYRGCDKTTATCNDVFSNIANYRGEPHVPGNDQIFEYPDAPS